MPVPPDNFSKLTVPSVRRRLGADQSALAAFSLTEYQYPGVSLRDAGDRLAQRGPPLRRE
jgi:hypothetical protein